MYNDQKTRNEGQTICTMIRRRTKENNMYNDRRNEGQTICTMIRRQGTKDKQYVQ